MAELNVLHPHEVDFDKIAFVPRPQKEKGKVKLSILYTHNPEDEPERLIVQTPKMRAPFGISDNAAFKKSPSDATKVDLNLSFDENDPKIVEFRHLIEGIDALVKKKGLEHAKEWINDDEPDEKSIRKAFSSRIKKPKEGEYPDTYRVSVPWDQDKNCIPDRIEFYNEKAEKVQSDYIMRGCKVVALIDINEIWTMHATGKFGITTRLFQLQVFKPKRLTGFSIKVDTVESDEEDSDYSNDAEM